MALQSVNKRQSSIDSIVNSMDAAISDVSFALHGVFSNHLAIKAAGHVEQ